MKQVDASVDDGINHRIFITLTASGYEPPNNSGWFKTQTNIVTAPTSTYVYRHNQKDHARNSQKDYDHQANRIVA